MRRIQILLSLIALLLGIIGLPAYGVGVDLHSHLFMKDGMPLLFRGHFSGPIEAKEWSDRFCSQVNSTALENSGLDIVVAALYAHPLLTKSPRQAIRAQVALAQEFISRHPKWILAKDPYTASRALQAGRQVMILSLEGAAGILETEDDLKEFIDQDGIKIVTLLHITDDFIGGVALLKGLRAVSSPIAFLKSLFSPAFDTEGIRVNSNGLTIKGQAQVQALLRHHVWIDLSHASDASQRDLLPILQKAGQPALYTHTSLRRFLRAERGISDSQLDHVAKTRGILGLVPSEDMLTDTPIPPTTPTTSPSLATQNAATRLASPRSKTCTGSVAALAVQFQEAAKITGELSVAIGSDFNGALRHLKPSCKKTGTSLDQQGFWQMEQSRELWRALENLDAWHPAAFSPQNQASAFIDAWSKF